jgi:SAM-dependent methyltransferase
VARGEQREVFDEVAALYDEVRPGYPTELVERVLAFSEIPESGRVLEVGPGPGKATVAFARRGFSMLCLEPGPALAARCREKVRGWPKVRVEESTFEAWPLEPGAFDLVMAAQSFHWVDPEVGYAKAADALRGGGTLALFWNQAAPAPEGSEIQATIANAYAAHAAELLEGAASYRGHGSIAERIAATGRFEPPCEDRFPWSRRLAAARYGDLLRTHSDHRLLPTERRERLVDAVEDAIRSHGGELELRHEAHLFLARVPGD